MRTVFKTLAFVICGLVMLQAASHAWVSAGIAKYVAAGGDITMGTSDGAPPFPEAAGFMIHAMNGMFVIPLAAALLVIVAFLAKIPGGVAYAGLVLALTVVQVLLGLLGHGMTALAFLHGLVAMALFAAALLAGLRANRSRTTPGNHPAAATAATH
ncbi:MAG: hypothetical protein Q4G46_07935 [Propionibacteriaceae bacterium]|nr:hypothetical protein [Propionibacteriaceae bacterium]